MKPIEVVMSAIDAMNRGEWSRVAELTDREDVERWYRSVVDFVEPELRPVTAAFLKEHQPDLPDAVAEYHADEINRRRADERGSLHGQFAGIDTRADLATVTPVEALTSYLRAQDPLWQLQQRAGGLDAGLLPHVRQGAPWLQRDVLGLVLEGEDLAHVVYRRGSPCGDSEERDAEGDVHVATLRRGTAGWRLRLRGELFEPRGTVCVTAVGTLDEDPTEDGEGKQAGDRPERG